MIEFLGGNVRDCVFIGDEVVERCFGDNNHAYTSGEVGVVCKCGKTRLYLDEDGRSKAISKYVN